MRICAGAPFLGREKAMGNTYSFLKDPRALAEVRKHKWLESQKAFREISFCEAALDWIGKFGEEWKRHHVKVYRDYRIFLERRRFRRFKIDCQVDLLRNDTLIPARAKDISFFGITCDSKDRLKPGSQIEVKFFLQRNKERVLTCESTVERIKPGQTDKYEVFLKFDNHSQEAIADYYNQHIN